MALAVAHPWASASSYLSSQSVADSKKRKKENRQPKGGMGGRYTATTQGFLRRGECGASRRPPLGVCLFLSLFAVPRRFSLQPSCHPAVVPLSSFSLLSLLPLGGYSIVFDDVKQCMTSSNTCGEWP